MHRTLIVALGGAPAVARRLGLDRRVVANWMQRGVAWPYRPAVAEDAKAHGVELPSGFLAPPAKETEAA